MNLDTELKKHGLRITKFRKELLELFFQSKTSLTVEQIRTEIGGSADKVTFYRALEAFESNGLIHKVPDSQNLTRYAFCTDCSPKKHSHNHAHFICNTCDTTICLDELEVPVIPALKNFSVSKSRLILEGNCPDCT